MISKFRLLMILWMVGMGIFSLPNPSFAVGLNGKIIVVDAGHGPDKGAQGLNGLTELEVNLQIAQFLKGYLEEAGATVIMTRYDDKGAFSGKTVGKHELAARVKIATEEKCDLFVSVHHNSNAQEIRSVNQTEIYFNVFDFGPSKDAAELIYQSLVNELGTPRGYSTAMPAEYFVLRKAIGYPAVLGEAAYIINPQAESLLKTEEYQKRQALGYFKGIQEYFNRGICKIVDLYPSDGAMVTDLSKFQISARVIEEKDGPGVDPSSVIIRLDGEPVQGQFQRDKITVALTKPLPCGEHTVTVDLRNKKGNSAMQAKSTFLVHLPPSSIEIHLQPSFAPPDESTDVTISALVKDNFGNPVGNGILVSFLVDNQYIGSALTKEGIAYMTFKPKSYITTHWLSAVSGSVSVSTTYEVRISNLGLATGRVTDMGGRPMKDVKIKIGQQDFGTTNIDGRYYIGDLGKGKYPLMFMKTGYLPEVIVADVMEGKSAVNDIKLTPYVDGILFGKTFIIDPAYGGSQSGPVGPTGVTSAETNLKVALFLKDYLEKAGAKVRMTRSGLYSISDIEKVVMDVEEPGNQYIIIHHGGSPDRNMNYCGIYRFPGQKEGLCNSVLSELRRTFNYPLIPYEGKFGGEGLIDNSDFVIVQTYGIRIEPCLVTSIQQERYLKNDSFLQREAYAIFNGILLNEGLDISIRGEITGKITDSRDGKTIGNVQVILDDGTMVFSNAEENHGSYQFRFASKGPHRVTVNASGYDSMTQAVLVNPGQNASLNFSLKPSR